MEYILTCDIKGVKKELFVCDNWYTLKNSYIINKASHDTIWQDGINLETIYNVDSVLWTSKIESLEQLIEATL